MPSKAHYMTILLLGIAVLHLCTQLKRNIDVSEPGLEKEEVIETTAASIATSPAASIAPSAAATPYRDDAVTATVKGSMADAGYVVEKEPIVDLTPYIERGRTFAHSINYPPVDRSLLNTSGTYDPIDSWSSSFPDINIVGFPKAGTSQMYRILTGHPRIVSANEDDKEFCLCTITPGVGVDLFTLFTYRQLLYQRRAQLNDTQMTVNGCIAGYHDVEWNYRYIPPKNERFIVMFRDPADWIWASWNFWTDIHFDADPDTPGQWTDPELHYRSPELFHEIIASNDKLANFRLLMNRLNDATSDAHRLSELVGKGNVLALRNEDIDPRFIKDSGALDRLASFIGVNATDFGEEIHQRTNCNEEKGATTVCGDSTTTGLYAISGKQKMLTKTRRLIYAYCQEMCTLWYDHHGIDYPYCRNASSFKY